MKRAYLGTLLACICTALMGPVAAEGRTLLAVGAHAGDMELTAGAVLARHVRDGDRVVLLHLTLGEEGNPRMTPEAYGSQKRREAEEAAAVLGAEVRFGSWRDGQLRAEPDTVRYVAGLIRELKATHLVTHWRESFHADHVAAHRIVMEALLPAALAGADASGSAWKGVKAVYFTENWEDEPGFSPYLIVDVSEDLETWQRSVTRYEFVRGEISSFPYLDYYQALARVRGARHGYRYAVAFDQPEYAKQRVLRMLP